MEEPATQVRSRFGVGRAKLLLSLYAICWPCGSAGASPSHLIFDTASSNSDDKVVASVAAPIKLQVRKRMRFCHDLPSMPLPD